MNFIGLVKDLRDNVYYLVTIFMTKWYQPKFQAKVEFVKVVTSIVKQLFGIDGLDFA